MASLKSVCMADFDTEVLTSKTPVLVDFWAEWCGPCKALSPTLEALADQYQGVLEIKKLNVESNPEARDHYRVLGIPMLALFVEGKEVARVTGTRSRQALARFIDKQLDLEGTLGTGAAAAVVSKAFDGDRERKALCERRLSAHIASQTVAVGSTMWDGTQGSALGCATEKSLLEDCAIQLGVPASVIGFVDMLSTYYGTTKAACQFVHDWLEALTAGVITTDLPQRMVLGMLRSNLLSRSVGDDALLHAALHRVVEAHTKVGEGTFTENDWAPIREMLSEQRLLAEGTRRTVFGILESSSWMARDEDALTEVLRQVARLAGIEAGELYPLPQDEQVEMERILNETAKRLAAEGQSPREAPQILAREMPERWKHFQDGRSFIFDAMRAYGQEVGRKLMECTKALGH